MSLIDIIYNPPENWTEENESAYEELFGGNEGRYPLNAKGCFYTHQVVVMIILFVMLLISILIT